MGNETPQFTPPDGFEPTYEHACRAEPEILQIERVCRLIGSLTDKQQLSESFEPWHDLIKPWASLLVGWERGVVHQAKDDPKPATYMTAKEFMESAPDRVPPETFTESWLRKPEAWDLVTVELCRIAKC